MYRLAVASQADVEAERDALQARLDSNRRSNLGDRGNRFPTAGVLVLAHGGVEVGPAVAVIDLGNYTVDAMWLQCRQDYYRLVHAIGCIEDDAADEVLEAANRLWEENRDKQRRLEAVHAELIRGGQTAAIRCQAALKALAGSTPKDGTPE
jgi:hypothetical protein